MLPWALPLEGLPSRRRGPVVPLPPRGCAGCGRSKRPSRFFGERSSPCRTEARWGSFRSDRPPSSAPPAAGPSTSPLTRPAPAPRGDPPREERSLTPRPVALRRPGSLAIRVSSPGEVRAGLSAFAIVAPASRPSRRPLRDRLAASGSLPAEAVRGPRRVPRRSGRGAARERAVVFRWPRRFVRPKHGRSFRGRGARRCGSPLLPRRFRPRASALRGRSLLAGARWLLGSCGERFLPRQVVLRLPRAAGAMAAQPPSCRPAASRPGRGGLEGVTVSFPRRPGRSRRPRAL
jgi:hypothetical protein